MELTTVTVGGGKGREMVVVPFTSHGITVPAGFIFDGASTPQFLWWYMPPYKRTKKAAVVHDWLSRKAVTAEERLFADNLFYDMLLHAGFSKTRARMAWYGVRAYSMWKLRTGERGDNE